MSQRVTRLASAIAVGVVQGDDYVPNNTLQRHWAALMSTRGR